GNREPALLARGSAVNASTSVSLSPKQRPSSTLGLSSRGNTYHVGDRTMLLRATGYEAPACYSGPTSQKRATVFRPRLYRSATTGPGPPGDASRRFSAELGDERDIPSPGSRLMKRIRPEARVGHG